MFAPDATVSYLQTPRCPARCAFNRRTKAHHDRLLNVDHDLDEAMELIELAVTWGELDYSERRLVPPSEWAAFFAGHRWSDPDRAERIFSLAADAALHSERAGSYAVR